MGVGITGWEQDKRGHFDAIVENYDKIRPEYPGKLTADVIDFVGYREETRAIEIGAGTGKATTPFLNAGYNVTAIEISENMAGFMCERFRNYPNFNVITAAFEDTILDENSYDLIYAASAFHWVNAEIGCPKVFRLLKSGGVFALLRYNFLVTHNEALDYEIHTVYEKYYFSYYTSKPRTNRYRRSHDEFREPAEILKNYGFEDMKSYGFDNVSLKLYDVTWSYDADEYISLLETFSDHRHLPEENRAALYAGVKEKIINYGGYLRGEDVFQLYMGKKL